MNKLVSVMIGTRNHSDRVIDLCDELKKQTFQNFNIIIFDDVSNDSEKAKLKLIESDKVIVYSNPPPWRFEGDLKWNSHLKIAIESGSKYIYNLHDDMKLNDKNLLEVLVNFLENNNEYGGVGPAIYNGEGVKTRGEGIVKKRMKRNLVLNESYLVRLKCFMEMGLINEKLIYYGSEDYQFIWMSDHGYLTKSIDSVSIIHYGGGTSTQYQSQKDFYRPRATILIIKLFCKKESLQSKLRLFYNGVAEPRSKILRYIREYKVISFIKTLAIFSAGIVSGLLTRVTINQPYVLIPKREGDIEDKKC
jgi:glycosyltransferase involved in cell wall biosynthesis